jgi:hypothetical protein
MKTEITWDLMLCIFVVGYQQFVFICFLSYFLSLFLYYPVPFSQHIKQPF